MDKILRENSMLKKQLAIAQNAAQANARLAAERHEQLRLEKRKLASLFSAYEKLKQQTKVAK